MATSEPKESSDASFVDQYPGLAKTLGSFPEVLSSVTEEFLSASLINPTTKAAIKSHSGPIGAQLLLDTLELKLQQSKNYETVALALLKKQNDLKDVFAEKKKPVHLEVVPQASSPSGPPRGSPLASPRRSPRGSPLSSPKESPFTSRRLERQQPIQVYENVTLKELMESFDYLLDRFIELAPQYLDFLKVKVSFCLRYAHYNSPEMEKIISEFDRCSSVRHAVRYLKDLGFLSHLNFQFLRFFQNAEFKEHLLEHEAKYRSFMENNLDTIAEAMGGATTSETSQGGSVLPEMTVIFKKWGTYALSRWVDKLEHSVDWSEYIMMKSIKKTSSTISITYNILPFILSKVVSYIDDSNTVKEFDKVGVAFELPQSVMEQGKTEAVTIESQIRASLEEIKLNAAATVQPQMETPSELTFGSHSYNFLTPLQDDFKCNVCYGVLRQTIYLDCCGKLICKGCNRSAKCPFCKDEKHKSIPRKRHDVKVMNLKVLCRDKDCYWTGRLGDLEGHKCPESESDQQKLKEKQEMEGRIAKTNEKIILERIKLGTWKSLSEQSFDESSSRNGLPNNLTTEVFPDGKCVYTVSGPSAKEIDWQDKGVISVSIPAGIVPPHVSCSITVKPIQPSQCTFPNDMVLVSELFEVTTSCDIKEPITMKLRHCVALNDTDQSRYLTFIKAEVKESPYNFKKHEGGTFSVGSEYGYLDCRSFSFFGICTWVWEKLEKFNEYYYPLPLRCCALLLHAYNERKRKHIAHAIVTKDNGDLIKETAKNIWKDDDEDVQPQKFLLSSNELLITYETKSDDGHWEIQPYRIPSKISRSDIEGYDDPQSGTEATPPWLNYRIIINKGCPNSLALPFTFDGASSPLQMNLFVEIPIIDSLVINKVATDGVSDGDGQTPPLPTKSSRDYLNHNEVYRLVEPLKVQWVKLGMKLGVPYAEIEAIDREKPTQEQKLMKMLLVWLRRGRKDQPIPSWRILHDAVETLDRNIADVIAEEHPFIDQHPDMLENGHNEMSEGYDEVTLSILDQEPSLKVFMRHIGMKDTIKNGWDDFGKSLGFTEDQLVSMTKQETKSGRILAIYDAWEKKQINRDELTWRSLFKNLQQMKSIKRDIKEWREDVIEEIKSEQMAV